MINVKKTGKHLGAEISGVDLSQELDSDTFAQVAKAFFDNEVVVFRNQELTPAQQAKLEQMEAKRQGERTGGWRKDSEKRHDNATNVPLQ